MQSLCGNTARALLASMVHRHIKTLDSWAMVMLTRRVHQPCRYWMMEE